VHHAELATQAPRLSTLVSGHAWQINALVDRHGGARRLPEAVRQLDTGCRCRCYEQETSATEGTRGHGSPRPPAGRQRRAASEADWVRDYYAWSVENAGVCLMSEFLTADELAERLRLRPGTVRRWALAGKIPAIRISPKVVRFDPSDVERALREAAERRGRSNG
jgi:excisionase family DNA binding protein